MYHSIPQPLAAGVYQRGRALRNSNTSSLQLRSQMFPRVSSWSSLSSGSTSRASLDRTSFDKGGTSTPPHRHSTVTAALALDVAQLLHQEMLIGGVLHVSAAQAHSCMERFDDLGSLSAPSVSTPLPPLDTFLAAANSRLYNSTSRDLAAAASSPTSHRAPVLTRLGSAGERLLEEALCLAQPPDNPMEDTQAGPLQETQPSAAVRRARAAPTPSPSSAAAANTNTSRGRASLQAPSLRAAATNSASSSSNGEEVELLEQLEAAACQHCCAEGLSEGTMPRASMALARTRRRRILRLLRDTREARDALVASLRGGSAAQLLAQLSGTFAGLTSLDGVDVQVCDAQGCVTVWSDTAQDREAAGRREGQAAAVPAAGAETAAAAAKVGAAAPAAAAALQLEGELAAWLGGSGCDHDCMACLRYPHGMCAQLGAP